MSKSTTIITSTTALGAIADRIAAQTGAPSKQRILNTFAQGIAGAKHDWGYLTGQTGPVIQKGLTPARRPDAAGMIPGTPRALRQADPDCPALTVRAVAAPLYTSEESAFLAEFLDERIITICEDFSTDIDYGPDVQCMFEPTAILARGDSLAPASLWGMAPDLLRRAGPAYFAAAHSAQVNTLISTTVETWPEDAQEMTPGHFKAFHLPHALVITTEYPFEILDEAARLSPDEAPDSRLAIQVFVDETLDDGKQARARAEVEDFLLRLAAFLRGASAHLANIRVT